MAKFKRYQTIPGFLFVYTTVMAICFLTKNGEMSSTEKWITFGVSYVIIILLYFVLRRKERLKREREEDMKK
jgi:hypothetical protein